mgnify:CR=1 FL=1
MPASRYLGKGNPGCGWHCIAFWMGGCWIQKWRIVAYTYGTLEGKIHEGYFPFISQSVIIDVVSDMYVSGSFWVYLAFNGYWTSLLRGSRAGITFAANYNSRDMYSSADLERFYFQHKTETLLHGESLQSFCVKNAVPYNLFHKWYKDTRNKIITVLYLRLFKWKM